MTTPPSKKPFTVFPRQTQHTRPVFFTAPKILSAIGHAMIGPLIYILLQVNAGSWFLETFFGNDNTNPVEGDRVAYFVAFSSMYGLRWALGTFTTNAGNHMPMGATIQVVCMHTLFFVIPITILSITGEGVPAMIQPWDYFAFGLSALAGILQQGSELQRLLFKRDPANKGKLHTKGLFGYARYINHTGHFLQDVAFAIATRSKVVSIIAMIGIPMFVVTLTPETEEHMYSKYKEKYEAYVKATPYKFIPFVW